jgi:CheY-like chemotaxis protein
MANLADAYDIEPSTFPRPPLPPRDSALEAPASDSSSQVRVRAERDTAPPPALHLASMPPASPETRIAESVTGPLLSQMEDCAHRAEILATTLRVGALSREEASRILRTELAALGVSARATSQGAMASLALHLREVVEEIGGIASENLDLGRDILVLDADRSTGALLALAVESHGHAVRLATSLADLNRLRVGTKFDAIFVAMDFPGADPKHPFCRMLREIVGSETVPVVVYGRASEMRLMSIAVRVQADGTLRIDMGIEDLVPVVGDLLARLASGVDSEAKATLVVR